MRDSIRFEVRSILEPYAGAAVGIYHEAWGRRPFDGTDKENETGPLFHVSIGLELGFVRDVRPFGEFRYRGDSDAGFHLNPTRTMRNFGLTAGLRLAPWR